MALTGHETIRGDSDFFLGNTQDPLVEGDNSTGHLGMPNSFTFSDVNELVDVSHILDELNEMIIPSRPKWINTSIQNGLRKFLTGRDLKKTPLWICRVIDTLFEDSEWLTEPCDLETATCINKVHSIMQNMFNDDTCMVLPRPYKYYNICGECGKQEDNDVDRIFSSVCDECYYSRLCCCCRDFNCNIDHSDELEACFDELDKYEPAERCIDCGSYYCEGNGECGMYLGIGIPPEPCDCCLSRYCVCDQYLSDTDSCTDFNDSNRKCIVAFLGVTYKRKITK